MCHQKKPRNNEMNTTVFLLLFCILTAHCGHGGYQSELNRDFYRRFSGQPGGGYNYGQINPRANSQAFVKSGTYSNAASGCGYVARNGLPSKDEWSTSQAFSNIGEFGGMSQNTGQLYSNDFGRSQAKKNPLTSGQSSGGYGSDSYANQGQESVQKGLEHNVGQKVEYHGNEFGSPQSNAKQGKSMNIESNQSQKSAYGFNHNSGNDYGSPLSKGSLLGIEPSNANTQFIYNRQDNTEHGQKYTYERGVGSSEYQAGIQSEGLKAGHVSGQSSALDGNSNGNTQYITGHDRKYTYGRGGLGSEYQVQSEGLDAGHISEQSSESDGISKGNTQDIARHGQKYTYGRGGLGSEYQAEIQSEGFKAGPVSGQSLESGGNSKSNTQYITGHGQKYAYGREDLGSEYQAGIQSEGLKAGHISGQSSESDGNSKGNTQDIAGHGQKYTYGRGGLGSEYQAEIQSEGFKAGPVSGQSLESGGNSKSNTQYITGHGQKYAYGREDLDSEYQAGIQSEGLKAGHVSGQASGSDGNSNSNLQSNNHRQDSTVPGHKYTYGRGSGGSKYQAEIQSVGLKADRGSGQSLETDRSLNNNANSNENQESWPSSAGASDHEDLQSTLNGALGLASQGLQASQNQPCRSCQKSSYAFSNAKSHSGSAVALSIAG